MQGYLPKIQWDVHCLTELGSTVNVVLTGGARIYTLFRKEEILWNVITDSTTVLMNTTQRIKKNLYQFQAVKTLDSKAVSMRVYVRVDQDTLVSYFKHHHDHHNCEHHRFTYSFILVT